MTDQYILNLVPYDSFICLALESLLLLRLSFIYAIHFKYHPILTTMVTNAILTGISDTLAQTLMIVRARSRNIAYDKEARLDSIRERYDLPHGTNHDLLRGADRPFDLERQARFVCYGFLASTVQFSWYSFLEDAVKGRGSMSMSDSGHRSLIVRLLADQILYAPFSLLLFFAFMNVMEGNSTADLRKRLAKQFVPALKAQYLLWPVVQFVNFKFVPLMYQLPVVSTVSVGWNIYLSIVLGR